MKLRRVAGSFGSLLKLYSFFFLIPAAASLYWDEAVASSADLGLATVPLKSTTVIFVLSFVITLLVGFVLSAFAGQNVGELREREALFVVGVGWLTCALLGGVPFLLTKATQDPSIAFFEAMSGLTTTGFSALAAPLEQYSESTHVWRATLHLFGGMGIVLIAVAVISRLTEGGARMMGGETGGEVERLQPKLSHTARALFLVYVGLNTLAFFAFWGAFHLSGLRLPWKDAAYEAYVHSVAAIATGGFSTRSASLAAFNSDTVIIVATVAMFLGGISFPLYFRAVRNGLAVIWRNHEFRFYLSVIGIAFLGLALFFWIQGRPVPFILVQGPFYLLTSLATCGFTAADPTSLPDGAKLILLFLMFTGAMVGSTTGAIKLARIQLLLRLTAGEIQRLLHPRAVNVVKFAGHIMPEQGQRRVVVFFFTYVTVFFAGALLLNLFGFDFDSSIVASAATLGGVGYGWGQAGAGYGDPVGPAARYVGATLMWMGRLEIFTVLVLFFPRTYRD